MITLYDFPNTTVITGTLSIKWLNQLIIFSAAIRLLSSFRFAFYNILKIRSNYGRCHKKNQSISTERKPCIYIAFFLLNVWHLFDCVCACLRPFTKKTQSVWNSWNVREQINGFALTTFLSSAKSLSLLL